MDFSIPNSARPLPAIDSEKGWRTWDEADYLADHIIVIDHGKVIAEGNSSELKGQVGDDRLDIVIPNDQEFEAAIAIRVEAYEQFGFEIGEFGEYK